MALSKSLLWAIFPSSCALLLHLLLPGGAVGSHRALIILLSVALCFIHFWQDSRRGVSSCCILSAGTIGFFSLAILFGAHPVRFLDTLSWSFFMTVLIFVTIVNFHGCRYESESWKRIFLECRFQSAREMCAYAVTVSTVMGAWVGAFPILLDWNRPWQVWPTPCSAGALAGNLVGHLSTHLFPAKFTPEGETLLS